MMGRGRLVVTCLAGLLAFAFGASPARASLVEALDLAALVRRADQVVLARVMASESHFDEHGRIVTDVQLQVERAEKGDAAPGASITVRRLGGDVGNLGMRIEGEPSFELGETVLLFGEKSLAGPILRPVGMSQGAMRIVEREGERWVRSAASGAALVKRGPSGEFLKARAAIEEPRKLEELLVEIRALVAKK